MGGGDDERGSGTVGDGWRRSCSCCTEDHDETREMEEDWDASILSKEEKELALLGNAATAAASPATPLLPLALSDKENLLFPRYNSRSWKTNG